MAPANERFRTDQAAIRQTDLWLIKQFEFISLDGARQFGLKRQARFKLLSDGAFEHHVPAALRCLGATKCKMAVAQQFFGRPATARIDGGPDADPDAVLAGCRHDWRAKREPDAFGQLLDCFAHPGARNCDGEFVAAQSCDDSCAANCGVQSF